MKIILQQEVSNLGERGEVKEVADGYARNYLIPKGYAIEATPKALKDLEYQQKILERKEKEEFEKMKNLAEKMDQKEIKLRAKVGSGGKLFGSITSKDIAGALEEEGIKIDRRKIDLPDPIRGLGVYNIQVKLHPEITAEIKVTVEEE
ncbi:MAG: 50S ribosomal protein L9 [Candidatus Syntrophonatronum acetioxidans]|uniref:Large ribosomal subunit protein bL9 n=1 Tax=Candidatus Syntrophonatronum acetioxidans TaxID=1795816 RepID=A0A424YFS5_9FIRM|nr:MAG: 50S ribosomal protein L9 [Candidatus Syntrophonatronum acetioxidans]